MDSGSVWGPGFCLILHIYCLYLGQAQLGTRSPLNSQSTIPDHQKFRAPHAKSLASDLCPMAMPCFFLAPLLQESLYISSLPYSTRNHELDSSNSSEVSFCELSGEHRHTDACAQNHIQRHTNRCAQSHQYKNYRDTNICACIYTSMPYRHRYR